MITFYTNDKNDIYLNTAGRIDMKTDIYAVLQACRNAAQTLLGELVLQGNVGIPNFQLIWSGSPNLIQYENALRTTFLGIQNVDDVTELDVFVENNVLKYNATIKTIYGEGSINA